MGTWATLGVVAAMVLVIPALAATASAAPAAAAGPATAASASTSQQWAYGGQKWVNISAQIGNATYQSHAFFGWQVVYTATNTSAGTVELEAQRTMGADLFAQYNGSRIVGNLSVQGHESETGFANLSTTAQVYENGSAVSAVGIDNASSQGAANLTESYSLSAGGKTASGHLDVQGNSHSAVSFSPSFGLVPWNVTPGQSWNSSATYTADAAWSLAYQWSNTGLFGFNSSGSGSPNGSVTGTGSVALSGTDLGTVTLANGRTVPVIAIALTGPFDDVDGFILVPHGFEIFDGGAHAWGSGALGTEAVATDRLDLAIDAPHHSIEVVASATSYSGQDNTLASSGTLTTANQEAAPAPSSAVVQGQPESVADAQHNAACLAGGCGSGGASGAASSILVVGLVVGLVAVLIVGTVGVVEYRAWSRRKSGGHLVGGYSQQVTSSQGLPPPQGPTPPSPPTGGA
ncbi:MAG: hypothetical protein L3K16_05990 [Thermoplasmata archaeon]|nr:hypothetical protein [Thermoplasmata archaeon]